MLNNIKKFFMYLKKTGIKYTFHKLAVFTDDKLAKYFGYSYWRLKNEGYRPKKFKYNPLISVIAPDNSTDTVKSLKKQYYKNYEVIPYDKRDLAKGEFIIPVNEGDTFTRYSLYEAVRLLNENSDIDFIYGDNDFLVGSKRKNPYFKPDWSPHTILSDNYIYTGFFRREIVPEYEGIYDLILKFSEKTDKIYHIPKILYTRKNSKKDENDFEYLKAAVKRRNYECSVKINRFGYFDVDFKSSGIVSIIIPTKDKAELLEQALKSIYEKTALKAFEIIIVNNNSTEDKTFELFKKYEKQGNFRVIDMPVEFNFSRLNNEAARYAEGDFLLFLNNDIKVIDDNWLDNMVGMASNKNVGCVGAKLLYPNDTIQHAGVVLGLYGGADHIGIGKEKNDAGYFGRYAMNGNYSAVTAACMMIRKSVFDEVGGYDENLKVCFNDTELCIKVIAKGYFNVYLNNVTLYHYESASRGLDDTPEKQARMFSELEYFRGKWADIIDNDPFYNPNLSRRKCDI